MNTFKRHSQSKALPALPTRLLPGLAFKAMAATVLLIGAAGVATRAHADNLYWSVGIGSPGVSVGITNGWPGSVYAQPAPVYVQPAPVYMHPAPVYLRPAPVFVQPVAVAPIYYQAMPVYQPGWAPPGRAHGWHKNRVQAHRNGHGGDRDHDGRRDGPRR
jgi:hypothetical protein